MFSLPNKRDFGSQIEVRARQFLEREGCIIIETNFNCKLGEIDLIAKHRETLVFVEVRYRNSHRYGGATLSVDKRKQSKLIKTASFYLQQKKLTNKIACRFDVIAITGELNQLEFNWIENAFN
ncbi:YraN family protein [Aliikangiella sp. IMCC44632]